MFCHLIRLEAKPGCKGRVGLRDVFWKHINEAKDRLREEDPSLTKTQALDLARQQPSPQYTPFCLTLWIPVVPSYHC